MGGLSLTDWLSILLNAHSIKMAAFNLENSIFQCITIKFTLQLYKELTVLKTKQNKKTVL